MLKIDTKNGNHQDWYRLLFDYSNDAVFIYQRAEDGSPGKFMDVNPAMCSMFGYTKQELMGLRPFGLASPEKLQNYKAIMRKSQNDARNIFETIRVTKNGRRIPIEASSHAFELDGKETILVSYRDISERKQKQEELQDVQRKLFDSAKLSAIGEIASGISHELRNPLSVIKTAVYILDLELNDIAVDEKIKGCLELIGQQIDKSVGIIENLLNFIRTRKPKLEIVSLGSIIDDVLTDTQIPANTKIRVEQKKLLPKLHVDKTQITQVFSNIVNNAIQAMPNGGEIVITSQRSNGFVETRLKDTGTGIDQENINRIFEPLFSTKGSTIGVGIGLALCKSFVESHNGTIEVESKVNHGATFIIKLPVDQGISS